MVRSAFGVLSVACALASGAGLGAQRPAPVQPESVEQGFILLVTDKTDKASADSPIYLASNHNGWNPGDQSQRLTRRSDGKWQIALPKPKLDSRIAFKFARGSWEQVEVASNFADIDNRNLAPIDVSGLAPRAQPVIELAIEHWRDERPNEPAKFGVNPYRPIKVAAGRIARVEVTGGGVPVVRDLLVWLPPGYDEPANEGKSYPVLYMQDGQNLFEALPGVPGEWQADETASRLIKDGSIEPLIIVGIPSTGAKRVTEYSPIEIIDGTPAAGDAYVEFLVREVMPRVDRAFRIKTGPANTGVGGSSLGAIIALHAAARYPDRFGRALLESPPLLLKNRAYLRLFESAARFPDRVYIGMGGKEVGAERGADSAADYAKSVEELEALCSRKSVAASQVRTLVNAEDEHNEIAWANRLPTALHFLFPAK